MTFVFLLTLLASYRLWRLFAIDDFPPIEKARSKAEVWVTNHFGAEWAAGIDCAWCSGFWVTAAVVTAVWSVHSLVLPGLWYLAIPAGVGITHELIVRLSNHG